MCLKKIFGLSKSKKQESVKILKEDPSGEKGLNEEMVSSTIHLEPKENNGLAKIFEETGKEESEEPKEEIEAQNK